MIYYNNLPYAIADVEDLCMSFGYWLMKLSYCPASSALKLYTHLTVSKRKNTPDLSAYSWSICLLPLLAALLWVFRYYILGSIHVLHHSACQCKSYITLSALTTTNVTPEEGITCNCFLQWASAQESGFAKRSKFNCVFFCWFNQCSAVFWNSNRLAFENRDCGDSNPNIQLESWFTSRIFLPCPSYSNVLM